MLAAVVLAAAALGGGGQAATVVVDDVDFQPRAAKVKPGGTVTWRFAERYVTHNVHSVGTRRFKSSKDLKVGARYKVRFKKPGTYRYVCTLHPGMDGRVLVKR